VILQALQNDKLKQHFARPIENIQVGSCSNRNCPNIKCVTVLFLPQVWFQNRRAKYRKQEKQVQKAMAQTVIPTCNGIMRNMYPTASRGYQPYGHPNTINTMNRYPQVRCSVLFVNCLHLNGNFTYYRVVNSWNSFGSYTQQKLCSSLTATSKALLEAVSGLAY
jgi:hypothetical protein